LKNRVPKAAEGLSRLVAECRAVHHRLRAVRLFEPEAAPSSPATIPSAAQRFENSGLIDVLQRRPCLFAAYRWLKVLSSTVSGRVTGSPPA
jgi:hypothetical protein